MTRLSKVVLAVWLVLAVLICRLLLLESAARFSIGPSLPPGKVQPQLISASDQAVLLAPDGTPVLGSDDYKGYFAGFNWVAPQSGTFHLLVTFFESVNYGELLVQRD